MSKTPCFCYMTFRYSAASTFTVCTICVTPATGPVRLSDLRATVVTAKGHKPTFPSNSYSGRGRAVTARNMTFGNIQVTRHWHSFLYDTLICHNVLRKNSAHRTIPHQEKLLLVTVTSGIVVLKNAACACSTCWQPTRAVGTCVVASIWALCGVCVYLHLVPCTSTVQIHEKLDDLYCQFPCKRRAWKSSPSFAVDANQFFGKIFRQLHGMASTLVSLSWHLDVPCSSFVSALL